MFHNKEKLVPWALLVRAGSEIATWRSTSTCCRIAEGERIPTCGGTNATRRPHKN